jgi:hypothetical protein
MATACGDPLAGPHPAPWPRLSPMKGKKRSSSWSWCMRISWKKCLAMAWMSVTCQAARGFPLASYARGGGGPIQGAGCGASVWEIEEGGGVPARAAEVTMERAFEVTG